MPDQCGSFSVNQTSEFDPSAVSIVNCAPPSNDKDPGEEFNIVVEVKNNNQEESASFDVVALTNGSENGRSTASIGPQTRQPISIRMTAPSAPGEYNITVELQNLTAAGGSTQSVVHTSGTARDRRKEPPTY
jgi:hypothetical protein